MNKPEKNKINFSFFSLSAYPTRCYSLAIASSSERWKLQRENKEKNTKHNFDVIGCRKQCQMVARLQPSVAFVPAGEKQDFLVHCRRVIISTEPIRAAEEIQDLARVTPQ